MANKKRYYGIIPKYSKTKDGKRKKNKNAGKSGFISQYEYLKQNLGEIDLAKLDAKEIETYKKVVRYNKPKNEKGQFISENPDYHKKVKNRLSKFAEKLGQDYDNPKVKKLVDKSEIFFTVNSMNMFENIFEHEGKILINGKEISKSEAFEMFQMEHLLNIEEWASKLKINPLSIYGIIYNANYNHSKGTLNISTVVTSQGQIIRSK